MPVLCSAGVSEGHVIPTDKGLSSEKISELRERGEPIEYTGEDLYTIGMPIGGIAAGQMYLRGDGTLASWQIFNKHIFTGYGAECYRTYRPESPVDSGFAVVVGAGDDTVVRALDREFGRVRFRGEYPVADVSYESDDMPVEVEMRAFSPFIPLNAEDSALPGTVFQISLKNVSERAVSVGLVGRLENAVCFYSASSMQASRRSKIIDVNGRTMIVHTIEEKPASADPDAARARILLAAFEGDDYGDWEATGEAFGDAPARGTLSGQQTVSGFLGDGLVNTFIDGDAPQGTLTSPEFKISRKYINFLIGGGHYAGQTCINLIIDDEIVRTAEGRDVEKLEWHSWNVGEFEGSNARIRIVDAHSGHWGHINIDQIEFSDEPRKGYSGPIEEATDYGSMVLATSARTMSASAAHDLGTGADEAWMNGLSFGRDALYPADEKRSTAIATRPITLKPGAEHESVFVLSWFFPNHPHGREYANRFDSAAEVAQYVFDDFERLAGGTRTWHETFYADSTLPRWLLFRLHSTVCNLATGTCQWWGNGRFWAWEGVGCCEGTCTHVWNYAQAVARLFPALERSAREFQDFGEGFHPDSGLVGFRSNDAYAADGQCGTILKTYREHQMSPDSSFLKRVWPRVKKALEFSIAQDENEDGLIENSQHNTFDINFEGPNTFVGSLYLAALRAGEEMAMEMGDLAFASRCHRIFKSGKKLTIERLWNGEYFIEDVDLDKYPRHQYGKGCLSDQLFGQGWAHQLGLGYIYPREHVRKALESIWKYNWTKDVEPYNELYKPERWFIEPGESGLFTCTWPKTPYIPEGVRYKNEVWTGIEYQVAGHMAAEGMVDKALLICDGIQRRYHPSGNNPYNEVECGDHYARAFASWGVYLGLTGYEYNGPAGHMGFAPKTTPEDFQAAFTAAEGWGSFRQTRGEGVQKETIELRWGHLRLKSLAFELPEGMVAGDIEIKAAGKVIPYEHELDDGKLEIMLNAPVEILKGQRLEVIVHMRPLR